MDFNQAGVILRSLLPWRLCLAAAVVLSAISSGLYAQDQDLPTVVSNVKVEPSPFSPNGDGENEFTKFSFTLSEPSRVTVDIVFYRHDPQIGGQDIFFIDIVKEPVTIGGETDSVYLSSIYENDNASGPVEFFWYGTLSEGWSGLLPDTTYTFLIQVDDLDGDDRWTSLPITGNVTIDKVPPAIFDISAVPDPFSPDGDGIKDFATVSFKLSGIPQIEEIGFIGFYLTLPDADGNRFFDLDPGSTHPDIYNPNVSVTIETGPVPLEFIKRSNNSEDFTFQVSGGRILDTGDTITVLTDPITILAADPLGKVYPDQRRQKFSFITEVTGVSGSTTADENNLIQVRTSVAELKVEIRDRFNQKVATLDPQFLGGREYTVSLGPDLDDGRYTYIITAADQAGNQVEVSGSITALSNPISITDLVIDPDTISPQDSNALYDFTNISFRLTRDGLANLQIFRDSTILNNLVRTLMSDTLLEAGGQTLRWDGRNQEGDYVKPGAEKAYRVIISAFDPVNFEQTEARGRIYVDNRAPPDIELNRLPSPTQAAAVTVSGISEPDVRVQPYINGTTLDSLRSDPVSGLFKFQPPLSEGLNLINALAFDRVENGPTFSDTLSLVLDTRPPEIVDTLIYVEGEALKLLGAVLLSFGPADTIEIGLSDGVEGQVSGLKLESTSLRVSDPGGRELEGTVIYLTPGTVRFVPLEQTTGQGTYTLRVGVEDSLGNKPAEPYPVTFNIGAASTGPTLVGTTPDPAVYLNAESPATPWTFTAEVTDNSGTGINTETSRLELFSAAADTLIAGTSTADAAGNLSFEAAEVIATDGSMDGEFELRIIAEDNDPTSGTLTTSVKYFYDTRRPDTLKITADSSLVAVTLADFSPGSGIDLTNSSIEVTFQGAPVTSAGYTNDGDSTLFAEFDPHLSTPGSYTINVVCTDRAGNSRTRSASFFISAGITIIEVVPVDGSIVSRSLAEGRRVATITIQDRSGTGIDSSATYISLLDPEGRVKNGVSSVDDQGRVSFTLARFLAVDGSDDGRYTMQFNADDKDPATGPISADYTFLYDTQAPDTLAVIAYGTGRIDSLAVLISDKNFLTLLEFSGTDISPGAISFGLFSPDGQPVTGSQPVLQNYVDLYRLTRHFEPPLSEPGVYTVQLAMQDLAGNSRTREKSIFIGQGIQVVGVVPADGSLVSREIAEGRRVATVTIADLSGSGIGSDSTYISLLGPGGKVLDGESSVDEQGNVSFTLDQLLAVDGSEDGRYTIQLNADDNDPDTDPVSAEYTFLYDTQAPDTLAVTAYGAGRIDSLVVRITDKNFLTLQEYSGTDIDPAATFLNLLAPDGQPLAGPPRVLQSEKDGYRLTRYFEPPLTEPGVYNAQIAMQDLAGNSRERQKLIELGRGVSARPQIESMTPAGAGAFNAEGLVQPLTVSLQVADLSGSGLNLPASWIQVLGPDLQPMAGSLGTIPGDPASLVFIFDGLLSTDGSDDGFYRVVVHAEDFNPQSADLDTTLHFIFDTTLPDTLSVAADSGRVAVTLADPSPGSGIDLLASSILVSFGGVAAETARYTNDGDSTLFADFEPPLSTVGDYTIAISAVDRAGNTRLRSAQFSIEPLQVDPPLVVDVAPPLGEQVRAVDLTQPLVVGILVQDNSGTGIDWQKSTLTLIGPDSAVIGGEIRQGENALALTLERVLSNSGAEDGLYLLQVHLEDFSAVSADLDTSFSFIYDNLPPDTTAVAFAPDTSWIAVALADLPAVAGRASSGLDILTANALVTYPDGQPVPLELIHDGQSTITLNFTGGKPSVAGDYSVQITAEDFAGNRLVRRFSFPLNIGGSIVLFPPDSSVVFGALTRITAAAGDSLGLFAPGAGALLRIIHQGLAVLGTSAVVGDTLVFTLTDSLPTDGRADGRYDVTVEMDIPALGDKSSGHAFFTVDNLAPDTVRVEVRTGADEVLVRAEFSDGGSYPEVSGIDRRATRVTFEDPGGSVLVPVDTLWLDENNLEARFSPFEAVGVHTLQLIVADRAGWSVTRTRSLINTYGLGDGGPVAFVEEVPARTSARINYISGNPDNRIAKAVLRIFNLRGDLIRRVDVSERIDPAGSSVTAEWLLDNDRGRLVMNGVFIYYWEITFADGRKDKVRKTLAVAR